MIDKFLSLQFCYCNVMFAEHKPPQDASSGTGEIDTSKMFFHTFIVERIKPLARQDHKIEYEIDLVSAHWLKCMRNIQYTNYDRGEEPVFTILKNCMRMCDLAVDDDSFSMSPSQVAIPYITTINDNMFTVSSHILHNLYYMPQKDDSVKFLYYDVFSSKFKILDLKNRESAAGTFPTIMSMFKTDVETLVQQEPTNLGSLASSHGKCFTYETLFNKSIYGYSYAKNDFTLSLAESDSIANYMNNKIDTNEYRRKYDGTQL